MEQKEYWERYGEAFTDLYERPTWFNRVFRHAIFLRAEQTIEAVRRTPGATVLDVGCGNGRNAVLLIKAAGASRVVGVDLAEDMIERARQVAEQHGVADRCTFLRQDFLTADLGDEVFDYSVALGVLDYFRDPTNLLTKMRRHTRYEALASIPGSSSIRMVLRKARYMVRGLGVYWFTPEQINKMFRDAGFAECRIEPCAATGWMAHGVVQEPPDEQKDT
ncbi:MAG: class I SAM-dependent methyltransferase [Planctomycetes bacterium]|nr:class I SAM-dependent methyltransferase [Planctomycetota bacterium]